MAALIVREHTLILQSGGSLTAGKVGASCGRSYTTEVNTAAPGGRRCWVQILALLLTR